MRTPHPEMTCGFLIQLVFCKKIKTMWFIGVEVEQETSAAPPKKNPGSALDYGGLICFLATSSSFLCAGTLSPRGKCCNFFARGLIGVDKHLFQRVSRITSMTLPQGANNPERSTAINSCNGVFTSEFIFR